MSEWTTGSVFDFISSAWFIVQLPHAIVENVLKYLINGHFCPLFPWLDLKNVDVLQFVCSRNRNNLNQYGWV